MTTKREITSWMKKIDKQAERVAKERDRLDDLIQNLEGLRESSEEAYQSLLAARDHLSELV